VINSRLKGGYNLEGSRILLPKQELESIIVTESMVANKTSEQDNFLKPDRRAIGRMATIIEKMKNRVRL
jgi:hypothetical protein